MHHTLTFYEVTSDDVTITTTTHGTAFGKDIDSLRLRCDQIESWMLLDDRAIVMTTSGTRYDLIVPADEDVDYLWASLIDALDRAVSR